jgi:hypothetical protein
MSRMGTVSALARTACAALLALLLGLRLLSPAGFMPAFERGAVTIVACPDASVGIAPAHRNHPAGHKSLHQPCPYAAASALGAIPDGWPSLLTLPAFAVALKLGRAFPFVELRRANERPHPTGPPIPA